MKVEGMKRIKDTVMEKHVCQTETHTRACTIVALAVERGCIGEWLDACTQSCSCCVSSLLQHFLQHFYQSAMIMYSYTAAECAAIWQQRLSR